MTKTIAEFGILSCTYGTDNYFFPDQEFFSGGFFALLTLKFRQPQGAPQPLSEATPAQSGMARAQVTYAPRH